MNISNRPYTCVPYITYHTDPASTAHGLHSFCIQARQTISAMLSTASTLYIAATHSITHSPCTSILTKIILYFQSFILLLPVFYFTMQVKTTHTLTSLVTIQLLILLLYHHLSFLFLVQLSHPSVLPITLVSSCVFISLYLGTC